MTLRGADVLLKLDAEEILGDPISESEFLQALPCARRKWELSNKRDGTAHGKDYLAKLIVDSVRILRLVSNLRNGQGAPSASRCASLT